MKTTNETTATTTETKTTSNQKAHRSAKRAPKKVARKAAAKKSSSKKRTARRGPSKSIRSTMIQLLQKNKGRDVKLPVLVAAVKKAKGFEGEGRDKGIAKTIAKRAKSLNSWAKRNDFKLVVKAGGIYKLAAAA